MIMMHPLLLAILMVMLAGVWSSKLKYGGGMAGWIMLVLGKMIALVAILSVILWGLGIAP